MPSARCEPLDAVLYRPLGESAAKLELMCRIDELYLQYPFYGSRQMARHLAREGYGLVGTGCGG